jgi:hypothetical protein
MKAQRLKFDVFGRLIEVEAAPEGWMAFLPGNEGKRRPANIPIPPNLDAAGIARYFDDLFHESATPENPRVRVL